MEWREIQSPRWMNSAATFSGNWTDGGMGRVVAVWHCEHMVWSWHDAQVVTDCLAHLPWVWRKFASCVYSFAGFSYLRRSRWQGVHRPTAKSWAWLWHEVQVAMTGTGGSIVPGSVSLVWQVWHSSFAPLSRGRWPAWSKRTAGAKRCTGL